MLVLLDFLGFVFIFIGLWFRFVRGFVRFVVCIVLFIFWMLVSFCACVRVDCGGVVWWHFFGWRLVEFWFWSVLLFLLRGLVFHFRL